MAAVLPLPQRADAAPAHVAGSQAMPAGPVDPLPAAPSRALDARSTAVDVVTDTRPLLFISDLHLSPAIPRTVAAFTHFIEVTAANAQAVYILGDLFEYWIGDDELGSPRKKQLTTPWALQQCELMRSLSARGIPLYIMHGNRDFLLGKRFAAAAGATLLTDPYRLEAFGRRLVLTHGDALCTLDLRYQRFRRITRQRWIQGFFLSWPLTWRLALARKLRNRPMQVQTRNPLWDVTDTAVAQLFDASHTHTMIHGHTHLPARHLQGNSERWVLPDWDLDHGAARGGYLQLDAAGLRVLPLQSLAAG